MRRQWRRLSEHGELSYMVARQPEEIRYHLEEFLTLEDTGWKGRRKSSMVSDRYRAAFAREAINSLAETDSVRIHSLALDGEAIASMIVFVSAGEAWTWKTAYNEDWARYSPGKLLVDRLTEWHLDDLNIRRTDSCAVPDHPIMSRMWSNARPWAPWSSGSIRNMTAMSARWPPSSTSTATPAISPGCCAKRSGAWPVVDSV
jgi:hypothetical protein